MVRSGAGSKYGLKIHISILNRLNGTWTSNIGPGLSTADLILYTSTDET